MEPLKDRKRQQKRQGKMETKISLALFAVSLLTVDAFSVNNNMFASRMAIIDPGSSLTQVQSGKGFGVIENAEVATQSNEQDEIEMATLDTMEIKRRLLDLLPRMMGTAEEFDLVTSYVNTLEDRYSSIQTLDFLNLAMAGVWQLLFSTNLADGPKPGFRLREMFQRIEADSLEGAVTNQVTWDLADDGIAFDASGTFTVKCSYQINQGARMVMDLEDHIIELAKGSVVPKDVQSLVGRLYRAMPKELFDPSDHAVDTTYLDGDLRIARMTGPRFEAVRDIFIRRGSMEINPLKNT
jgi:hypothetical protein